MIPVLARDAAHRSSDGLQTLGRSALMSSPRRILMKTNYADEIKHTEKAREYERQLGELRRMGFR